jgi:hypothetical protein
MCDCRRRADKIVRAGARLGAETLMDRQPNEKPGNDVNTAIHTLRHFQPTTRRVLACFALFLKGAGTDLRRISL